MFRIIYYIFLGGRLDHVTHVPGPVAQSSADIEYNASCTAVMTLAQFRILIHELLNKEPDIVPEEAPLLILDGKSDFFMDKNDKDTNHTSHISR